MIQFTVPGIPVAKARARVTMVGGFARAYTPAKTRKYEEHVSEVARRAMGELSPSTRPIEIMLELRMPIPASWTKAKRAAAAAGSVRATKKPDADNVLKGVKDALNGICWVDDSQVVVLTVRKLYAIEPCVIVAVRQVEGDAA